MKYFYTASIFILTLFSLVPHVFADPIVIADLSIHEQKIINQEGTLITIAFDFDNGEGAQSQIKYGVSLMEAVIGKDGVPGGFISVDEKVYDEIMNFSPNSTTHREVKYEAPRNLTGEYALFLDAKNLDGLHLSSSFVGEIELSSKENGDTLEIVPKTCFMTVRGEGGQPHYTLSQGPDISSEESLVAHCDVVNNSDKVIEIVPVFETYYRTIYGEKVRHSVDKISPITLKPRETKSVTFVLPKAMEPQAYDVKASFVRGTLSSNTMIFHYVLRGASASIQLLSFDKDVYNLGDTAKLMFLWSPSADGFDGSRANKKTDLPEVRLNIKITNTDGDECSSPVEQVLDQSILIPKVEILVPITRDCRNPKASVTIKDVHGNSVAQGRDFLVETKNQDKQIEIEAKEKQNPFFPLFIGTVVLFGFIGLFRYVFIKIKNKYETNVE